LHKVKTRGRVIVADERPDPVKALDEFNKSRDPESRGARPLLNSDADPGRDASARDFGAKHGVMHAHPLLDQGRNRSLVEGASAQISLDRRKVTSNGSRAFTSSENSL
jgi:hypothetical protein